MTFIISFGAMELIKDVAFMLTANVSGVRLGWLIEENYTIQ